MMTSLSQAIVQNKTSETFHGLEIEIEDLELRLAPSGSLCVTP